MSTNLVVVAIPEEEDRVWKVSSEKVPHLTLLFLGDAEGNPNVQQIMQFVQHATQLSEHGPFYLDIARRGTLGEDEADVVFFDKRSYNLKWVKQFRHQLLQNGSIREAYDSTEQHPEWLPHLTLGYPETPAKGDDDDRLYSVAFDRIAVWTGNYEGPDFQLEWPDREMEGSLAVAYADTQKAALTHYGVKGMRWGVRRSRDAAAPRPPGQKRAKAKRALKGAFTVLADSMWYNRTESTETLVQVHNRVAEKMNGPEGAIAKLNASPKYRGKNLNADHKLRTEYEQDFAKVSDSLHRNAVRDVLGTNYSKTKKAVFVNDVNGPRIEVRDNIRHAVEDDVDIVVPLKRDPNGHFTQAITAQAPPEDSMAQAVELGEGFVLEHYGVKGMRWGVRKEIRPVDNGGHIRVNPKTGMAAPSTQVTTALVGTALVMLPLTPAVFLSKRARSEISAARKINKGVVEKKQIAKADAKFDKKAHSAENFVAIHNGAEKRINSEVQRINEKYKDTDLTKDPAKQKEYDDEVVKSLQGAYRESANQLGNRTMTRHLDVEFKNDGLDFKIVSREGPQKLTVEHAAADQLETVTFSGKVKRVATGHIVGFEFRSMDEEDSMAQTAELGEEFVLKHYGIKGMRWGVRNRKGTPVAVTPTATSKVPAGKKRKTKIEVKGGENHEAAPEAIAVAKAKAKLQKSGTAALTNKELVEVQNRLNLENNVTRLVKEQTKINKGRRFVKNVTGINRELNTTVDTGLQSVRLAKQVS